MKVFFVVLAFLSFSGSAMASAQAIHLSKKFGGTFAPSPITIVTVRAGAQPTLEFRSQAVNQCVITDGDAKSLGTSLLDLARILSPKNQAESVIVTCQDGDDPYASATLVDLVFM